MSAKIAEQMNMKLGSQYADILRRMKKEQGVSIRHVVEAGVAAYLYNMHPWESEAEFRAMVGSLPQPDVWPRKAWWHAPDPLPATVAELGPCPKWDMDFYGARAWVEASKAILERAAEPMVEV